MRLRLDGDVLEELPLISFRLSGRDSSRFNSPTHGRLAESRVMNYPSLEFNEQTYLDDDPDFSTLNENMGKISAFNKQHQKRMINKLEL